MSNPNPAPPERHRDALPVAGYGTVADIRKRWLQVCGSCDWGLPMSCTCPEGDPRGVISALCDLLDQPGRDAGPSDECGRCALEADHFGPCWWPGDPENNDDDT